jgi:Uma2 family endonuclease
VATISSPRIMTADELLAMPDDGNRYELVRGELVRVSPSAVWPGIVAGSVFGLLWSFLRGNASLGVCGISESGFRLTLHPDTVRSPDVWFVRAERVPAEGIPEGFWPGAPDLAVEVLSPSDRFVDVMRKVQEYLAAGVQLVWVIDPKGRSAAVFAPERPPLLLGEDGVLDGGDLLPGFSLRLGDILP